MGWKGESRRHSLSRKGIKTNIDKTKRLSVSNFVARGNMTRINVEFSGWVSTYDAEIISEEWFNQGFNTAIEHGFDDDGNLSGMARVLKLSRNHYVIRTKDGRIYSYTGKSENDAIKKLLSDVKTLKENEIDSVEQVRVEL